ncbi:MAG: hypothetical protein DMF93_07765 [Acidobacteria bacterium]|nr:MAG: hypothetical protein DMF93_07765 [Acidobacteriota bacterium]
MIESDGFYQIILFFAGLGGTYAIAIMSNERDRVISITLSEAEWQAFVSRQPQPVNWLRDRIKEEVRGAGASGQEGKSAA